MATGKLTNKQNQRQIRSALAPYLGSPRGLVKNASGRKSWRSRGIRLIDTKFDAATAAAAAVGKGRIDPAAG